MYLRDYATEQGGEIRSCVLSDIRRHLLDRSIVRPREIFLQMLGDCIGNFESVVERYAFIP